MLALILDTFSFIHLSVQQFISGTEKQVWDRVHPHGANNINKGILVKGHTPGTLSSQGTELGYNDMKSDQSFTINLLRQSMFIIYDIINERAKKEAPIIKRSFPLRKHAYSNILKF